MAPQVRELRPCSFGFGFGAGGLELGEARPFDCTGFQLRAKKRRSGFALHAADCRFWRRGFAGDVARVTIGKLTGFQSNVTVFQRNLEFSCIFMAEWGTKRIPGKRHRKDFQC